MLRKKVKALTPIQQLRMKVPVECIKTSAHALKRKFTPWKPRKTMRRVSKRRAKERRGYRTQEEIYLGLHPFDMIVIAMLGMKEETVIANGGQYDLDGQRKIVPRSTQVHHRNKARGARLNDERWWMATSGESHDLVEHNKGWGRWEGYLLPMNANPDGQWPSGNGIATAWTTDQLMYRKAATLDLISAS